MSHRRVAALVAPRVPLLAVACACALLTLPARPATEAQEEPTPTAETSKEAPASPEPPWWQSLVAGEGETPAIDAETAAQDEGPEARRERREQERLDRGAVVDAESRLERTHARLRRSALGSDPTVRRYLDLMESGRHEPEHLAALGSLLSEYAYFAEAAEYYREAIRRDPGNVTFWVNLGTIYRQSGDVAGAVVAYRRALRLDRNHALAHYNLGAAYDALQRYDEAVAEYLQAIVLDPRLADPQANPQVVNNEHLAAISLMYYRRQTGASGLPLIPIPDTRSAEDR